ncbi:hypothetical protein SLS62_000526 [Diatrype stigma]|uniref:F-box domain-containing protein n=1 Tax=Diatrype stigma TaxID=117547 RepID=A0AAN9V0X7_9PEZI
MPPEVKVRIMKNLDAASLSALTTTCRSMRDVYTQNRGSINDSVSSKALGHARTLAFALYAANCAPWKAQWPVPNKAQLVRNVHRYGRKYLNHVTDQPSIPTDQITLPMILKMGAFHRIVEKLTDSFFDNAVNMHTHKDVPSAGDPSITEVARAQRGFYAIEITRVLLPYEVLDDFEFDPAWNVLWHYFSPWENRIARDIEIWILFMLEWYEIGLSWMRMSPDDTMYRSLNIDHIIARYPEVEIGARDLWYYLIYVGCKTDKSQMEINIEYECISWWDLARFQTLYPGVLPTLQNMQDELMDYCLKR